MPDLGGTTTLLNSETLTMTRFPNSLPSLSTDFSNSSDSLFNCPVKTLISDNFPIDTGVSIAKPGLLNIRFTTSGKVSSNSSIAGIGDSNKVLEDYVSDWKVRRINSGVPENRCFLSFLLGAPSLVECRTCSSYIYPGDEVSCSVRGCQQMYHGKCIKETLQFSALKKFKCPQHVGLFAGGILKIGGMNRIDFFYWLSSNKQWQLPLRVQSISCSKACRCSDSCTNRPFRKEKKLKIVKTGLCGWGVEAAESINKGDFVIEYVGEVVDDVECTQRLWAMKNKDVKNFYMCEIRKDFTIDATFKGNASRFLNHSCDPNCKMEKWQVEGEIRVGVFASRSIEVGEPLTYDYRFVQFGTEVKCHCGAANCQGYLGAKRKINLDVLDSKRRMHLAGLCWGSKRRRAFATQVGALQLQ
ncbi:hypothetical protein KSS87_021409 [Heliosperma pusillum]|nr:hypothetical protein KSS87_021409 [Heliosperma pusillum]